MHRFVRIATAAMDAPLATIALVRDDLQVAVGRAGRHSPVRRRAPLLARPLCEAVIASAAPIIVEDVHADERWCEVVDDAEIGSFIGVPLLRHDGVVLGGLAAIDGARRTFSAADLDVLYDLGGAVTECLDARDLAEALALRSETLAHDLRTPLSAVRMGRNYLASRDALTRDPSVAQVLHLIDRNLEHAMALTAARRFDPGTRDIEIAEVVAEAADHTVSPPDIEVERAFESGGVVVIRGDRHELLRCLDNLIGNALKFARTRVRLSLSGRDGVVRVAVDDDGPGLGADADYAAVWSAHSTKHRHTGQSGTGLGLSIVRRIVEEHGGTVFALPSDLGGACFGFTLGQIEPDES